MREHSVNMLVSRLLQITVVLMVAGCKGGPAPDFSGQWAEKSAERVVAVFTPAASGGYGVQIGWRETGLAQYEAWDMSAVAGKRGTLAYSDGRFVRLSFERDGDTEYVEDTVFVHHLSSDEGCRLTLIIY